jgi:hypothetical protein
MLCDMNIQTSKARGCTVRQLTRRSAQSLAAILFLLAVTSTHSFACGWPNSAGLGVHGGFLFFKGLIVQTDEQTGRTLTANQALSASSLAECAQLCLQDSSCSGVSHRPTASGQCLTFAGFDFETGNDMSLYLHFQSGIKYSSAIIRQHYQGPICN